MDHDPKRRRKLLLHRVEIRKLIGKTVEKGLTLVPRSRLEGTAWRSDVEVTQDDEECRVEIDGGAIQPGRRVWCEQFYIGVGATGTFEFAGTTYAANLPAPQRFALTVHATVTPRTLSATELVAIADRHDAGDSDD